MNTIRLSVVLLASVCVLPSFAAEGDAPGAKALVERKGEGWRQLGKDDFENVNCNEDTWTWKDDGSVSCTGQPVGVIKSKKPMKNLEMVAEWKHNRSGGNSGIFLWASEEALTGLKKGSLPPGGIEVQVL